MQVGLLGMRRRIADYDPALNIQGSHIIVTVAGYVIGLAVIIAFINLIYSAKRGPVASMNPWRSRSPESSSGPGG